MSLIGSHEIPPSSSAWLESRPFAPAGFAVRAFIANTTSSDFPPGVAAHFGFRLIGPLTAAEFPPTARDLVRSLTLPFVHAVARNTGDDDCFSSLRIHSRCCLRPYTGGSTIPFPNSPSNNRSRCHDGAIHSLSVRPERLPVPPDWVLRLRVGSASTHELPPAPDPSLPA